MSNDLGENITVSVILPTLEALQASYRPFMGGPQEYRALSDFWVLEARRLSPAFEVKAGQSGMLCGVFEVNGRSYYRRLKDIDPRDEANNQLAEKWHQFPTDMRVLWKVPPKSDEDINYIGAEIAETLAASDPQKARSMIHKFKKFVRG